MTPTAILDGKRVEPGKINVTKHILIGKFRDPDFDTFLLRHEFYPGDCCVCGEKFYAAEFDSRPITARDSPTMRKVVFQHWNQGHFDELVYQTVSIQT